MLVGDAMGRRTHGLAMAVLYLAEIQKGGMTVTGDGWWFNVRPSNTEPLLRLNVEAADEPQMASLRDEVLAMMRKGA